MKKLIVDQFNKTSFLILISLLYSLNFSYSQEINFEWESLISVPEGGSLIIHSTVVHKNNLYFTGSYSGKEISFGNMALANTGNRDYILGCLSLDGNPKWIRTAVGIGNERGFKIFLSNKDEIVVFGFYSGQNIVFNNEHHLGNFDPAKSRTTLNGGEFNFSAVYSLDGELLNASSKNIYYYDDQLSIAEHKDANGNSYFMRQISPKDRMTLENGTTYRTKGGSDYLIIKRNSNGKIEWVKQLGGVNDDSAILNVTNNHLTLATTYRSNSILLSDNIQLTNSNPGYESVGVIRLSLEGEPLWATDIPFRSKSSVEEFVVDNNGDVFLVGNTGTVPDGFVAKIAASGELVWKNKIGGVGHDYMSSIGRNKNDLLVLGAFKSSMWEHGFISPNGTSSPRPYGGKDLFLVSIDINDGTTKKFIQLGGNMSSDGSFITTSDALILCRNGHPGLYFSKITYSSIEQVPPGYSFKKLEFQDYERTGELEVQPDYNHITKSSELSITKDSSTSKSSTSEKPTNKKNSNVLEDAEKKVKDAKKKLKGFGKKL